MHALILAAALCQPAPPPACCCRPYPVRRAVAATARWIARPFVPRPYPPKRWIDSQSHSSAASTPPPSSPR